MEFHLALAGLSGCTIQVNTLKSLFDLLYLKYRGNILFVTPMETVDSEHRRLFEHIQARNLQGASEILTQHIAHVRAHAVDSINKLTRANQTHSL
jgi:DNA-binding GntR family transcriptional regulator